MVINLIFILLLLVCTGMLLTGRPLNIHVTHTHKVEEHEKIEAPVEQSSEPDEDTKELTELLQNFWGLNDEK
jgi:hypothetical protein